MTKRYDIVKDEGGYRMEERIFGEYIRVRDLPVDALNEAIEIMREAQFDGATKAAGNEYARMLFEFTEELEGLVHIATESNHDPDTRHRD